LTAPTIGKAPIFQERFMPQSKTKSQPSKETDAIALLMQDHREVEKMFKEFEAAKKAEDDAAKADIVKRVCIALTAHAEIEEEIFYPAVREEIKDADVMDEAEVEHGSIKGLVGELEGMQPNEDFYDAKVTVLAEYVKHHVKEEEGEMFPKVKQAKLDLDALGAEMKQRKEEVVEVESAA
jgi:hemerythrin superfamily protein